MNAGGEPCTLCSSTARKSKRAEVRIQGVWEAQDWAGPPAQGFQLALLTVQYHSIIEYIYYQQTFLSTPLIYCPKLVWAVSLALWSLFYVTTSPPDQEPQPTFPVSLMLASVPRTSPFLLEISNQSWACFLNPAEANLGSRINAAQNFQVVSGSLHKHSKKEV